jgi:hypothetical protein
MTVSSSSSSSEGESYSFCGRGLLLVVLVVVIVVVGSVLLDGMEEEPRWRWRSHWCVVMNVSWGLYLCGGLQEPRFHQHFCGNHENNFFLGLTHSQLTRISQAKRPQQQAIASDSSSTAAAATNQRGDREQQQRTANSSSWRWWSETARF